MLAAQGDGLASGGAADALPVFGRIVEPTLADAFWAAGAATATLFADLSAKWCGRIAALFRLGSSTGGSSSLLCPCEQISRP